MFIRSHLFISVLFVLILRGESKQNFAALHVTACSALFLRGPLYLSFYLALHLQFIFVYDGRLQSDFILIFIAAEPACCPPQWALRFHPQHQCGRVPCALHPLQDFIVCRVSAHGHCEWCEVVPH